MQELSIQRHKSIAILISVSLVLLCWVGYASAQGAPNDYQIGVPPHAEFSGTEFENVQLNNGNLHIEIPLWSTAGRGPGVGFKYVYDSLGWGFHETCNHFSGACTATILPNTTIPGVVLNHLILSLVGPTSYTLQAKTSTYKCNGTGSQVINYSYNMAAPDGTHVHFGPDPIEANSESVFCEPHPTTLYADDGSGWMLNIDNNGNVISTIRKDGSVVGAGGTEDTNGNEILGGTPSTDTLGRQFNSDGSYYDSSGVLRSLQVSSQTVPIQTNLCWSTGADFCYEYSSNWSVPQIITLPNGMTYTFGYNLNPTGSYYGQPLSVTLPTGGQITWSWSGEQDSGPRLTSRLLSGDPAPWLYSGPSVTDPAGNQMQGTCAFYVPPYSPAGSLPRCYIITKAYYQGSVASGTLVKTEQTDYWTTTPPAILPIHETTTWNQQNLVGRTETDYDSFSFGGSYSASASNPIEKREFGYGTGTWGPQVRTTDYGYLHLSNSTYLGLNILDKETSKKVYDGTSQTGTLVAQSVNTYDGVAIPTSGNTSANPAPNHDYTKFPASYNIRGNLTQISEGLKSGSTWSWLSTNKTYNDLGEVLTSTDPLGNRTSYDYTDSWATISNPQCVTSSHSYGFPTTITDPLTHLTKHTYYSCTSLLGSTQDQNDINASRPGTTYNYDLMDRVTAIAYPDGGQVTKSYVDTPPVSATEQKLVTTGVNIQSTTILDGLGRISQTQLNDPDCTTGSQLVKVDHAYGYTTGTGAFTQVSTPYCDTPNSVYGLMATTQHDALDRVTSVTQTDGSMVTTTYSGTTAGLTATVTDEAGKARTSVTDSLGRMTTVWEDPSGLNYETDYAYDKLGNLTGVAQKGNPSTGYGPTRSFTYDSLGRLKCAANPEVTSSVNTPASCPATDTGSYTPGTIGYTYDGDGNVLTKTAPAPNQTATSSTAVTTYSYDAVNRLTQKSYIGGATTATAQYAYDGNSLTGCGTAPPTLSPADANPVSYRTAMCDGSGATSWSHDAMGRVLTEQRIINGTSAINKAVKDTYYKDGELNTLTYPGSSRKITYTANSSGGFSAGRPVSAVDTANTINYVTAATYAPHGELASLTNGASILGSFSYNSRLQPLQMFYGTNTPPSLTGSTCPSTVGNILHRIYNFNVGTSDNGNVLSITNCRDTNRTQTITYDSLNRIKTAATQGTTCTSCWGQMFGHMSGSNFVPGIDAWGNLFEITLTQGTGGTLSQSMTFHNQFASMTYDASGNLINDGGGHTFTFDDENHLTAAAGYTYVYDGDGKRVKKCSNSNCTTGTIYWTGTGSDAISEAGVGGSITEEYIFFDDERVARRDASGGAVHYYFSDHLKSADVITSNVGAIQEESDYFPYGGENVITGSDINNYKFTGKERDAESGLDYFDARHYSSAFGRFMQPDWAAKPTDVPYANFGNPQSLNLYSYVKNNPTTFGDPDGHGDLSDFANALANAIVSDNLLGAGRQQQTSSAGKIGQGVGDFVATAQGGVESLLGGGVEVGGIALDATGAGAVAGVPANLVGAGMIAHGGATATTSFSNLFKSATSDTGGAASTESKPHGNTAGNQPAELYEKYDANGNFEKHGVSQDASKRYSKAQVNGGDVKVVDRGPRKEMLAQERQRVETNPGPKNREPWAGKKKTKVTTNH